MKLNTFCPFVLSLLLVFLVSPNSVFGRRNRQTLREKNHFRRSAVSQIWPNAIVPYEIDQNFPEEGRRNFAAAVAKLAEKTCVRFRNREQNDRHWLRIALRDDGGCAGTAQGRQFLRDDNYNGQLLSMSTGCLSVPIFEHELGHTLGFPHEQDRLDRDNYVVWDTSKPECPKTDPPPQQGGRVKMDQAALDILYDYVSIMHDWKECLRPTLPGPIEIGASGPGGTNTYSVLDYEKINSMYSCGGCQGYRFRNIAHLANNLNLVVGGNDADGNLLYICRVYHQGNVLVGKSKPDNDQCYIGADGRENEYKKDFEVLTNPRNANINWIRRPDDFSIPRNAIVGGRTVQREAVYIGRCSIRIDGREYKTPGTLYKDQRELQVPWSTGVHTCTDYDILVCNQ